MTMKEELEKIKKIREGIPLDETPKPPPVPAPLWNPIPLEERE